MPRPALFRLAMAAAWFAKPSARLLPARLAAMLRLAPSRLPSPSPVDRPQVFLAEGARRKRVALLSGCVQPVLMPSINEATIRLLARHGCEVVVAQGAGCCGSLSHHAGRKPDAHRMAKANIAAWIREMDGPGLDAIIINASGCGTTVKDYGFMLREDAQWAEPARRVSAITRDIAEFMAEIGLAPTATATGQEVAYHSACSMQHGQKIDGQPRALLAAAGFNVREIAEGHLCCGSAGTYNMLQPDLARRLRDRKLANIAAAAPDLVATGNIGCITQLASGTRLPVVHTVELLDWATGGPLPPALAGREFASAARAAAV